MISSKQDVYTRCMEISLFLHGCCCVLPWVSPFRSAGMLGGLQDSQPATVKYKQGRLYRNYSDATTVPQQIHSLHGQPVPAGDLCPHKAPCCNDSVALSLLSLVQDVAYCLISSSHWNKEGGLSSDTQIETNDPSQKSWSTFLIHFLQGSQLLLLVHTQLMLLSWAEWPEFTLLPLSLPSPTALVLSWQFFGQIGLVSWKGSSSESNLRINHPSVPQHGWIPSAQAPACTMLC